MTGALAAMTTWAQVSSLLAFMARPSRNKERRVAPLSLRKVNALRMARGSARNHD